MKIARKSALSGEVHEMDLDVTPEQLDRWKNGELIQNAMPHLTADEREFLMTGITAQEWKECFG